jgi:hypothetical protein
VNAALALPEATPAATPGNERGLHEEPPVEPPQGAAPDARPQSTTTAATPDPTEAEARDREMVDALILACAPPNDAHRTCVICGGTPAARVGLGPFLCERCVARILAAREALLAALRELRAGHAASEEQLRAVHDKLGAADEEWRTALARAEAAERDRDAARAEAERLRAAAEEAADDLSTWLEKDDSPFGPAPTRPDPCAPGAVRDRLRAALASSQATTKGPSNG